MVYMYHSFLIHSSADGHLGFFHVLAIINSAVMNMGNAVLDCSLKNNRMTSIHFQGKPFNIMVVQAYAPTSNAEEAEVEWFYENLNDLLEITTKNDVLFIKGNWNAAVGSQETPGVKDKFGLGVQNEAGQRLRAFCQEKTLVIATTTQEKTLHMDIRWPTPESG